MSGGLPKLNMKAVDDAAAEKKAKKKEKKTVKERVDRGRALVRQASASLKRGLTPRGSRVERDPEPSQDPSQDYPSQDYGSDSGTEEYPALTGALGPRESVGAVSDTESDTHQSVPSASADTYDPPTPPRPLSNPPTEGTSYAAAAAAPPADDAEPNAEPKDPEMMLPGGDDPEHQGLLKPSEDATAAAVEKKYQEITPAAYEEQVPEAEQEEEVQKEERAERGDSSKWRNLAIAVAVFAVGAVATEPVLNAVRKRKEEEEEPQAPLAGQEVAHKGRTWGFR